MAKLKWDEETKKTYRTGVKECALFVKNADGGYAKGVAWNGLSKISEKPSGAEPTALYANDRKYLDLYSNEDYKASIEAYMYPDEFAECDGSKEIAPGIFAGQQNRKGFGIAYKTTIGNDSEGLAYGYELHIVYNCMASPSQKDHSTINNNPEASTMSWELSTTPVDVPGCDKPSATITINSRGVDSDVLKSIEDMIYGTGDQDPTLPTPEQLMELVGEGE